MKHILLATDFSTHADIARQHAELLASNTGAAVTVVHAAITDNARVNAYELATGQIESFRSLLREQLEAKREQAVAIARALGEAGIEARGELIDGPPARAICAAAEERNADLVVIGSHGHTGFHRLLLGSVAERVVRLCARSVLVARKPMPSSSGFTRVLVPTDFADPAARALEQAIAMSAPDATVDLVHCWHLLETIDGSVEPNVSSAVYASLTEQILDVSNQRGTALIEQWKPSGRKLRFSIAEGRPAARVQEFIESRDPSFDLVAVGTHGRTGLKRLLLGSVAERTVRHSPCSVLVARAATDAQ